MKKLGEEIYQLERLLLQPSARKPAEQLTRLLADEFIEFGSSGRIYDKSQIVKELPSSLVSRLAIRDFRVKELGQDVVLATYRLSKSGAKGKIISSWRCSIWKRFPEGWRMISHRGTAEARP